MGQAQTVLQRMIEANRPEVEVTEILPDRGISLAMEKAARDKLKLPLKVERATESRLSLAELIETVEEFSMLLMIEGPGESLGFVAVAPPTLSSIIEIQTSGGLSRVLPPVRRPTRIDAAMSAELIDAFTTGVERELATTEAVSWSGGYRYASFLDDARPLGLLLEDVPYRSWKLEMELGASGNRQGELTFVVPAHGRVARKAPPAIAAPAAAQSAPSAPVVAEDFAELDTRAAAWKENLERTVGATTAELEAILYRFSMPLSTLAALRVGMEIPLPTDALVNMKIEAGGRQVATARLGQFAGMRAVRLVNRDSATQTPAAPQQSVSNETDPAAQAAPVDTSGTDFPITRVAI